MATTKTGGAKTAAKTSSVSIETGKMEDREFQEFFVDELKDIYWAEKHLVKANTLAPTLYPFFNNIEKARDIHAYLWLV